ncbi:MAG: hypothetical protein ACE3L7_15305 [Candidatus Pristimantibacillus sp.]
MVAGLLGLLVAEIGVLLVTGVGRLLVAGATGCWGWPLAGY